MTTPWLFVAVAATAAAGLLLVAPRGRAPRPREGAAAGPGGGRADGGDRPHRYRPLWCCCGAAAAVAFVGGPAGWVLGGGVAVGLWVLIARAEPAQVRRDHESARRELPHLVGLLGDALRSGQSPAEAVQVVVGALPGPAARRLGEVVPRLRLGADPAQAWQRLEDDPVLAPLGRALARSHRTGTPVVTSVERLAVELARDARGRVEDRARSVGVRAAVPLGGCLLPAFLLVGIVPLIAGLVGTLTLR